MMIGKIFYFALLCFALSAPVVFAQELPQKQRSVAERFSQLEQVLLRMSEASASSDPKRSALLKRVLIAGKDKLVGVKMENLVRLLEQRQLTETITGQEDVEKDLIELLRLLESENRDQRREAEKERIKQFLRELEELIHQEKALKAKTTQRGNEQISPLENDQRDIRLRSQTLRQQIDLHEDPLSGQKSSESENETKNTKNPENKDSNDKNSDQSTQKDSDGENSKAQDAPKPSDRESKQDKSQNDQLPQNKQSDSQSEPSGGPLSDQTDDESQKPSGSPTQQAMQKALRRMKQAEKKLKDSEKNNALENQEEAIAELQRVKAELEKILRQLREEELLQTLEKLEVRFKRMLKNQQAIRSQSGKLVDDLKTIDESARRPIEIQSARLGSDQTTIIADVDDALVLLREDGTAQAMTESLIQTRFDMDDARERLSAAKLDRSTLEIEDTIIASLQEMLDAISLAIKEAEQRKEKSQPPPGGDGGQQDVEPLIQMLSELRMIRSMQDRVNNRTRRYDGELEELKNDPNADLQALKKKVEELARQQNRISRILHDIKVGRTQ